MTYPPVRYAAATGEATSWARLAEAPPELVTRGSEVHYLATGRATGGAFGLYRVRMPGAPTGPSAHFHRTISETFYVLSGSVRLYDGARWLDGAPGDLLHVPVGGVHAFRNESGAPAELLLLFAPGAPREAYFEELARRQDQPFADEQERRDFLRRHDQYEV